MISVISWFDLVIFSSFFFSIFKIIILYISYGHDLKVIRSFNVHIYRIAFQFKFIRISYKLSNQSGKIIRYIRTHVSQTICDIQLTVVTSHCSASHHSAWLSTARSWTTYSDVCGQWRRNHACCRWHSKRSHRKLSQYDAWMKFKREFTQPTRWCPSVFESFASCDALVLSTLPPSSSCLMEVLRGIPGSWHINNDSNQELTIMIKLVLITSMFEPQSSLPSRWFIATQAQSRSS